MSTNSLGRPLSPKVNKNITYLVHQMVQIIDRQEILVVQEE